MDRAAHGLGLVAADIIGRGMPDILQADDREPNQYWVNQGNGAFVDEAVVRGCAFNTTGRVDANMGVAVGDAFNRGLLDILITHKTNETNIFFKSNGDGTWSDWTAQAGMARTDRNYTGWGVGFFDYDNDGNLDVATANGRIARGPVRAGVKLSPFWSKYAEPNLLYKGDGNGHFTDVSAQAGGFTSCIEVHHALAFGDLSNTGAIDLVEMNVDNTVRVFKNLAAHRSANHWLEILPMTGKREALGARLTLTSGTVLRTALCLRRYGYLASNDPRVHFGLGAATKVDDLRVEWPSGSPRVEHFTLTKIDDAIVIHQGTGSAEPLKP